MTFGATSAIFQQAMLNPIAGRCNGTVPTGMSATTGLVGDSVKVALFNNTTTPDKAAALAATGWNTGVWITANEVIDTGGSNWPTTGIVLGTRTFIIDTGSSSICFHAPNLAGLGNVTIANAYGCFVYDDTISGGTVAKQGMCYNSFGGSAQGVTAGTFTIVWATVGATTAIFNVTV